MRIRDVSGVRCVCALSESARAESAESGFSAARLSPGECRSVDFAMWASAMLRAPPMRVVGVEARSASVVDLRRLSRFVRMAFSTMVKGRYLLGFSIMGLLSFGTPVMGMSPSLVVPFDGAGRRAFGVG